MLRRRDARMGMRPSFEGVEVIGAIAVIGLSLFMTSGCRWPAFGRDSGDRTSADLHIEQGHQRGAMGDIEAYSASTFQEQGYVADGYAHVRLDSQGPSWWVMSSIDIAGVDLDELEPDVVYATATRGTTSEEGQPTITVVGCSGPSYGNYTYDATASRAEIEVQDLGDGARRVFFRAWFSRRDGSAAQLTEGSFDYRR